MNYFYGMCYTDHKQLNARSHVTRKNAASAREDTDAVLARVSASNCECKVHAYEQGTRIASTLHGHY